MLMRITINMDNAYLIIIILIIVVIIFMVVFVRQEKLL